MGTIWPELSGLEIALGVLGVLATAAVVVYVIVVVRRAIRRLSAVIDRLRLRIRTALPVVGKAFASGGVSLLLAEGERPHLPSYTERVLEAPRSFRVLVATAGLSLLVSTEAPETEKPSSVKRPAA
jgi:hypothetical protein